MTREVISLSIPDLSAFTTALRRELANGSGDPGHLTFMNMTARAAGYRNVQHLRAIHTAQERLAKPAPALPDATLVETVLRQFDARGRLIRWPSKTVHQHLAVRALWARLPQHVSMTEREISQWLNRWHGFGDAPILRRTMVELGLVTRSIDCRDYRRVEKPPTAEASLLIRLLAQRNPSDPA